MNHTPVFTAPSDETSNDLEVSIFEDAISARINIRVGECSITLSTAESINLLVSLNKWACS